MRKILAGLVIVGALGACGTATPSAPETVTVTAAPEAPVAPTVSKADQFRSLLDEDGLSEAHVGYTDAEIDAFGESVCTLAETGGEQAIIEMIRATMADTGVSFAVAGKITMAGIVVYCNATGDAIWGDSSSGGYTTA